MRAAAQQPQSPLAGSFHSAFTPTSATFAPGAPFTPGHATTFGSEQQPPAATPSSGLDYLRGLLQLKQDPLREYLAGSLRGTPAGMG